MMSGASHFFLEEIRANCSFIRYQGKIIVLHVWKINPRRPHVMSFGTQEGVLNSFLEARSISTVFNKRPSNLNSQAATYRISSHFLQRTESIGSKQSMVMTRHDEIQKMKDNTYNLGRKVAKSNVGIKLQHKYTHLLGDVESKPQILYLVVF